MHALPPTIFFFLGFNLILWTKYLILKEHGIEFSAFVTATLAALLVGKAVLVTDNVRRAADSAHPVQKRDLLALRTGCPACRGTGPFSRRRWRDR